MQVKFINREYRKLDGFCGLRIWEMPKPTVTYAIGADVAEGVGADASCAQVLNCRTGLLAACYWSNVVDTDTYAAELVKLGNFFNRSNICIEDNNHGHGVIALVGGAPGGLHYPNLYKRMVYDEYTQKKTKRIGFHTNADTKPRIIDNLKSALRDGEILIFDKFTIQELSSFVRSAKTGRMGAKGKANDDRVMGLALAWEQARIIRENLRITSENETLVQHYDPNTGFPIMG